MFLIFSCLGDGKGESEAPGRGGDGFSLKIPGRGSLPGGWRGRARRVFAGSLGRGGGG